MSAGPLPTMSNAAFAGFLRLLLTPLNEAPAPSGELRAYLDYLTREKHSARLNAARAAAANPSNGAS